MLRPLQNLCKKGHSVQMDTLDRIMAQILGLCARNPYLEEDADQLEALQRNQSAAQKDVTVATALTLPVSVNSRAGASTPLTSSLGEITA